MTVNFRDLKAHLALRHIGGNADWINACEAGRTELFILYLRGFDKAFE